MLCLNSLILNAVLCILNYLRQFSLTLTKLAFMLRYIANDSCWSNFFPQELYFLPAS